MTLHGLDSASFDISKFNLNSAQCQDVIPHKSLRNICGKHFTTLSATVETAAGSSYWPIIDSLHLLGSRPVEDSKNLDN